METDIFAHILSLQPFSNAKGNSVRLAVVFYTELFIDLQRNGVCTAWNYRGTSYICLIERIINSRINIRDTRLETGVQIRLKSCVLRTLKSRKEAAIREARERINPLRWLPVSFPRAAAHHEVPREWNGRPKWNVWKSWKIYSSTLHHFAIMNDIKIRLRSSRKTTSSTFEQKWVGGTLRTMRSQERKSN